MNKTKLKFQQVLLHMTPPFFLFISVLRISLLLLASLLFCISARHPRFSYLLPTSNKTDWRCIEQWSVILNPACMEISVNYLFILFLWLVDYMVGRIKPRALHILGKYSNTELHYSLFLWALINQLSREELQHHYCFELC